MLHLDKVLLTGLCGIFGVLVIYYMSVYILVSVIIVLLLVYAYYESQVSSSRIHVHGLTRPSPLRKLLINLRLQANSFIVSAMKTFRQLNPVPNNSRTNGVYTYQRRESTSAIDNDSLNYTTDSNNFTDLDNMENIDRKNGFSPFSVISNGSLSGHRPPGRNKRAQYTTPRRHSNATTNLSFSPKGSPWGTSVSPKLRSHGSGVKTVQTVAGPLLASTRYNINLNSGLYGDVNSPGFTSRVARYANDSLKSPTHQKQYIGPGQFPLVQLDRSGSRLPVASTRRSQGIIHNPVMVRIAPPDLSETRSQILSGSALQEQDSTKSVLEVLKEISRKRIHAQLDDTDDDDVVKRQRKGEGQNSMEQMTAGDQLEECGTIGKRPREESPGQEETSSRLHVQVSKRTRNNEILSSLSSSRNILNHMKSNKRKSSAVDWSRSSTPVIGKQLKSSQDVLREATSLLMMTKGTSTNSTSIATPTITTTITSSPTTISTTTSILESKEVIAPETIKPSEFLPKFAAVLDRNSGPVLNSVAALEAKRAHDSRTRLRSMLAVIAGEDDFLRKSETTVNEKKTEAAITSLNAPTLSVTAPSTVSSPFALPASSTSISGPSSGFSLPTPVTSSASTAPLSPSTSASEAPSLTNAVTAVTSAPFAVTSSAFAFGESRPATPVSSSSLPTFGVSKISDANTVSTTAISSTPNLTTVSAATGSQISSTPSSSGGFSFSSEKTVIEAARPIGTLDSTTTLFNFGNTTSTSSASICATTSSTASGFGSTVAFGGGSGGFTTQTSTATTTSSSTAPVTLFGIPKSTEKEATNVSSTLFRVPKSNDAVSTAASSTLSVSVFGGSKSSDKETTSISVPAPTGLFGITKSNEQKVFTSVSNSAPLFATASNEKETTSFSNATTVMFGSSVNSDKESSSFSNATTVMFGSSINSDKESTSLSTPAPIGLFGNPKTNDKVETTTSTPAPVSFFGVPKSNVKEVTSISSTAPSVMFGIVKSDGQKEATRIPTSTPGSLFGAMKNNDKETSAPTGTFSFGAKPASGISSPFQLGAQTISPGGFKFNLDTSKDKKENQPTTSTPANTTSSSTSSSVAPFQFGSSTSKPMFGFTANGPAPGIGGFAFGNAQPEKPQQGMFSFGSTMHTTTTTTASTTTTTTTTQTSTPGAFTFGATNKPGGFAFNSSGGLSTQTTQANSGGGFGSAATSTQPFGGSGTKSGETQATSGLFGSSTSPATNLFGNTSQPSGNSMFGSSPAPPLSGGLFSSMTPAPTSNLFGNSNTQSNQQAGLFGNTSGQSGPAFGNQTQTAGSGLFGNNASSPSLFGTPTSQAPSGSTPAFGSNPQNSGGIFGSPSLTTFGSTTQSNASSAGTLFGAGSTAQPAFSFGLASQQPNTSSSAGMFGASTSNSTSAGASATPFQFGTGTGSTTATPATGGFNFITAGINFGAGSSTNTPFQFGAGAGAGSGAPFLRQNTGQNMFSIGSGSTAPRARSSRMRRQR